MVHGGVIATPDMIITPEIVQLAIQTTDMTILATTAYALKIWVVKQHTVKTLRKKAMNVFVKMDIFLLADNATLSSSAQ